MSRSLRSCLLASAAISMGGVPVAAQTVSAPPGPPVAVSRPARAGIEEIIVTAQKRRQSLADVPMAITAQTGVQLAQRGVVDTADLGKVVSGFVYTTATIGEPVYTLRGVGLYDVGLASSPTVSVYVDQVPLAFSVMTTGAGLDLERVEVLKGPQGTLFGQNNTGGAVNYIAAKPTREFKAGLDVGYESYNKITTSGYVSGALSPTLTGRFAFKDIDGGAWQYAVRQPSSHLGATRLVVGRALLDWAPTDRLKVSLNLNAFDDRSDTQASQLQAYVPSLSLPGGGAIYPQAADSPIVNSGPRAANWAPGEPLYKNNHLLQASVRTDYRVNDAATLTSITSFSDMHIRSFVDIPGDQVQVESFKQYGKIDDFNQELRLAGDTGRLHWLVGANYEYTRSSDSIEGFDTNVTINMPFGLGTPPFISPESISNQIHSAYAGFANVEYKLTKRLTLQAGVRATQTDQKVNDCSHDLTPGSSLSAFFSYLSQVIGGPGNPAVAPYACYALNPFDNYRAEAFNDKLNEGNISYRFSADYKFDDGVHLYATDSRGYKAGIFSNVAASTDQQNLPLKQEKVDAYELGLKAPLFDNRARLNIAGFYYSYLDKQLRARINDPIFALLETLVTVPHSRIYGIDADFQVRPFEGLTVSAAGTYLNSEIDQNFITSNGVQVYDSGGHFGNFKGSQIPYTPDLTGNFDVEYDWPVYNQWIASVGSSLTYHDVDNTTLQANGAAPDGNFKIKSYSLLDLRAGVTSPDGSWHLLVYGRNVTNAYYSTAIFQATDTRYRFAGLPEIYGFTIGHNF